MPGTKAHLEMVPKDGIPQRFNADPKHAVKSAVMILLHENENGKLSFPVILRQKDNSVHSGQISLPGGRFEAADIDLKQTALRETEEEIGISSSSVRILGKLSSLYIPVSNFEVHPYIAWLKNKPDYRASENEVAQIYDIKLDELIHAEIKTEIVTVRQKQIEAPFFIFGQVKIWGATAMILNEFLHLLKD